MGIVNATAQLGLHQWLSASIGREETKKSLSKETSQNCVSLGFCK